MSLVKVPAELITEGTVEESDGLGLHVLFKVEQVQSQHSKKHSKHETQNIHHQIAPCLPFVGVRVFFFVRSRDCRQERETCLIVRLLNV